MSVRMRLRQEGSLALLQCFFVAAHPCQIVALHHINPLCASSLGLGIAFLAPFPPVLAQEIYALAAQGDNAHAVRYYAAWEEVR